MKDSFGTCVMTHWSPGIGDPDVTGWLTVLVYLLCAVAAALTWHRLRDAPGRGFWALMAGLMMLLAINKQLDLQSALTAAGRCLALAQGWYDQRQVVQTGFILVLLVVVILGMAWGSVRLRGQLARDGLALVGAAVLAAFVLVRAVGFHHVDALIGLHPLGVSANYLFENAGLLLIGVNAMLILRRGPSRAAPQS